MTGFQTTRNDMGSSMVAVRFADGSTSTSTSTSSAAWLADRGTAGGASTGSGSLSPNGDGFSSPWQLKNTDAPSIVGLSFDGLPGKAAFDIVNVDALSTGSASGKPFGSVDAPISLTFADGAYTSQVLIAGPFYGDLSSLLAVRFKGGLRGNGVVTFIADTDTDTDTIGPPVPEPEACALMLAGIGLVAHWGVPAAQVSLQFCRDSSRGLRAPCSWRDGSRSDRPSGRH